jgi:hypothetical protein
MLVVVLIFASLWFAGPAVCRPSYKIPLARGLVNTFLRGHEKKFEGVEKIAWKKPKKIQSFM